MPSKRTLPHLTIPPQCRTASEYKAPRTNRGKKRVPPSAERRIEHGRALLLAFQDAVSDRDAPAYAIPTARAGQYIYVESFPDFKLELGSLNNRVGKPDNHIECVATHRRDAPVNDGASPHPDPPISHAATVFIPPTKFEHFSDRASKYLTSAENSSGGGVANSALLDPIQYVRRASLRDLWTDKDERFPSEPHTPVWWEVWLRRTDGLELQRFQDFAREAGLTVHSRSIVFDTRTVVLAFGSQRALEPCLSTLSDLAELRAATESPRFFLTERVTAQFDWARDLAQRVRPAPPASPRICILDSGIHITHPLLAPAITSEDCSTCFTPAQSLYDLQGHGTCMAGIALYGDLVAASVSLTDVQLTHGLESVKILPDRGQNAPENYGAITAEAVARPEIAAPMRPRVFAMAVTAPPSAVGGVATAWSATIDAIAAGRAVDATSDMVLYLDHPRDKHPRLFIVSAGNVTSLGVDHLERSDLCTIEDPAQAWNALTVGAHTEKVIISDPTLHNYTPISPCGELSPWSSTSVTFDDNGPIKPDVVMEGGNAAHDNSAFVTNCDDLSLLTTHHKANAAYTCFHGTSAATAAAANMAATIMAHHPDYWPETIRGLIVHSARWTPAMLAHVDNAHTTTTLFRTVLRRYGFGVPDLTRALRSSTSAVTLIAQDTITPYRDTHMGDIHTYALPWPREELAALGEMLVRVRVTLSYFVEPNPTRNGEGPDNIYPSHALRFDTKRQTESVQEFLRRVNDATEADTNEKSTRSSSNRRKYGWRIGVLRRHRGSLHHDILEGTAAEIAEQGYIAVYPVGAWAKSSAKRKNASESVRYALIVSIETTEQDVNIWTPTEAQIRLATPIST